MAVSLPRFGYVLLFDRNGCNDWEAIYVIDVKNAKFQCTTIEEDIERQIAWEVETCGRDPDLLAVVEISEPIGVRGKLHKKTTFTDIKYRIDQD